MDAVATPDISLFADFRLDRRGGALYRRDEQGVFALLVIGRRALDILGLLIERPGDLVSRDEIIEAVWHGRAVEDSNLNVQIAALRRILDRDREQGSCIQTVSGRGYRFVTPVARCQDDAHTASHAIALPDRRAPRLSIVVLPFANLSDDRKQEYFADAMTDSLTTDLSRIAGSFVISRNTALSYRAKPAGARQIGAELGVRYVLEGSVHRSGNRIRINAQLIDADTESHLWAERFDRPTGNLFALQDEITSRIAVALNAPLIDAEAVRASEHPDVRDYIFRARAVRLKPPSRETYAQAIGLLERALELDLQSVEAQSYLASALADRVLDNLTDTAVADLARAEKMVQRGLADSPRSSLPYFAKGNVLRALGRYEEAIPEYETALVFDRNRVVAYSNIGQCLVFMGSIEEAVPFYELAIRLSPRDPSIGIFFLRMGIVHLLQSRAAEAVKWFEKARNANPAHPNIRGLLASGYGFQGEVQRAAVELSEARRLSGDDRFLSIACLKAVSALALPKIRALAETTYFAGLRTAGMPEE